MQPAEKLQSVRRLIKLLGWLRDYRYFLGKITKTHKRFRLNIDSYRNKIKNPI